MKKFLLVLLSVAIASFAIAACNSDNDSLNLGAVGSSSETSSTTSSSSDGSSESSPEESSSSSSSKTESNDNVGWTDFY